MTDDWNVEMKLLLLVHRLPCPADRGAKLRVATQLNYLARRHDVWCAGFLDSPLGGPQGAAARQALAHWRGLCRAIEAVSLRKAIAAGRAIGHGNSVLEYEEDKQRLQGAPELGQSPDKSERDTASAGYEPHISGVCVDEGIDLEVSGAEGNHGQSD